MAVKVREGRSGKVNLAGAKHWLTGDLGDQWGTQNKGKWVVVSFDPTTEKEQRDALAPIILKTYGLEWGELKVQESPIEINRIGEIAEAKLGGGQHAYMKLTREPGMDGKGVALKNVDYFHAQKNTGFELYRSLRAPRRCKRTHLLLLRSECFPDFDRDPGKRRWWHVGGQPIVAEAF